MAAELTHLRERLQAGVPLGEADRRALLELLGRSGSRVTRRNELIRDLARVYCPNLRPGAQAARIAALARRYRAIAWRYDREQAGLPERLRDKPERLLWLAFKTDVAFPFSQRQIERILK